MLRNFFSNNTQSEIQYFLKRIFISFAFILFFLFIVLINLYKLQILNFEFYKNFSNKNRIKVTTIIPKKGMIHDRNGIPIAINKIIYNINIIPSKVKNLNKVLEKIKLIINLSEKEIFLFKKNNLNCVCSITLKKNLNELELSSFLINKYYFPELKIKKQKYRLYPYNSILAHSIGYVTSTKKSDVIKKNNIGISGIERFYENEIQGDNGYQILEINNVGNIINQLYIKKPKFGYDIFLTIDAKLQNYISNLILGNRISIIVTDTRNSEILAMISSPSYNPNTFTQGISKKEFQSLINNSNYPLMNRVIQGNYSPASTVKPYIIISAIASGIINIDTVINDPGWWQLPESKKYYRDWKRLGHGKVDLTKSLEESVDTFFYQIAHDMGIDKIYFWMNKFGYGSLTGIDLIEENKSNMPNKRWKKNFFNTTWYRGDTIPIGIGQGYWNATPLQIQKSLLTIINNGKIKTPHLLFLMKNNNKYLMFKENNEFYINSKYWYIIKDGMYGVTNRINGTSYRIFKNFSYELAAKSGTAQLYTIKTSYNFNKINNRLRDHKLMIAFAPYNNPKIAISVILENGGENEKTHIGKIIRKIIHHLGHHSNFLKNEN